MTRLPSSFRQRNRTTESFRQQYARLPRAIQQATRDGCRLFDKNPAHPSFRKHELKERKAAEHLPKSYSVSITMQYRALFVEVEGINVWYWIGSHAQYDRLTKS